MKTIFTSLILIIGLFSNLMFSQKCNETIKENNLSKTALANSHSKFNINNISTYIYNNGNTDLNPNGNSGFEYPRKSNKNIVFESGVVWGGKIGNRVLVGGSTYSQGIVGGRILEDGTAQNPSDPSVRVYRVRPDYLISDLSNEIEDEGLTYEELFAQYQNDWNEWPAIFGAPFEDVDNNGVYNPSIDIPGVPGSHQTLWYVANDFDTLTARSLYGSDPMKIEVQVTVWGFKKTNDPYDNVFYKKIKLINKNNKDIDSMYISQWADPDVGGAADDLSGCDTLLNLGYAYNGDNDDYDYRNTTPAIGFQFLQGPIINGEENDTAIKNGTYLKGFKNLGITAFMFYICGGPDYVDPGLGDYYTGTLAMYNHMRGLFLDGRRLPLPEELGGGFTRFPLSGDPLTGEGYIPELVLRNCGDTRNVLSSGPFALAVGDTQEVVIAQIAAVGKDRLNSVRLIKYYADLLQSNYLSSPISQTLPHSPTVNVSESTDGILLSWGDENSTSLIENFDSNGYQFQGYNVYQLYSEIPFKENSYRVATFDIKDGVTSINGRIMDSNGKPINGIQQFGSDSGIQREFLINKDYLLNDELLKGKKYHFGISAYAYNKNSIELSNVETPLAYIEVEYIKALEGVNYGDQLEVRQTKGISGGKVIPIVVRPSALTGLDYTVTFSTDTDSKNIVWNLDRSDGVRILENQILIEEPVPNYQTDTNYYPIIDGLQLKVYNLIKDFKLFSVVANANGPLDPPEPGAFEFQGFPVPADIDGTPLRPSDRQQVGSGKWGIHTGDPSQSRGSYENFLSRSVKNDDFDRLIPYDWEMRFTSRGSWAIRWFEDGTALKVPFELWNTGINTPDDPSDDYRLIPYFLSTVGSGGALETDPNGLTFQLDPVDHGVDIGINDPQTPWIYWIRPHLNDDNSSGKAGYNEYISQIDTTKNVAGEDATVNFPGGTEVFARTVLVSWDADDVSDGIVNTGTQMVPEEGTIFRIETNKPIQPGVDEFRFNSFIISGIEEDQNIPKIYELSQNYPNPFNPITKINYSITLEGRVKISVYNILGQKVTDLVNTIQKAGNYQVDFNGSKFASGVYIYRIETDKFILSKKMLLLK